MMHFTAHDIRCKMRKVANWKVPGLDGIPGFWWKQLLTVHEALAKCFNDMIKGTRTPPPWMTCGRTTLIQKDATKGTDARNYRPITCLPVIWKIMSGLIADYIQMAMIPYMAKEQKGVCKGSRGTKDHLLIDKAVIKDSRTFRKNLAMAWIDYQKAYDSVPHSWILESLKLYNVNTQIVQFIRKSMDQWKTQLTCAGQTLEDVNIKRGIFQGDALSPLLFCIALNPLSELLNEGKQHYAMKSGKKITHLLCMDDLKLYAENPKEIDSMINTAHIFSNDIGMNFGLDKCARLILQRGRVHHTDGIELPEG